MTEAVPVPGFPENWCLWLRWRQKTCNYLNSKHFFIPIFPSASSRQYLVTAIRPQLQNVCVYHDKHTMTVLCQNPTNMKMVCAPGRTRTCNPRIRSPMLYPVELRAHNRSGREDSNLRHPAPKAGALPDCATPRYAEQNYMVKHFQVKLILLKFGTTSRTVPRIRR